MKFFFILFKVISNLMIRVYCLKLFTEQAGLFAIFFDAMRRATNFFCRLCGFIHHFISEVYNFIYELVLW